MQRNLNAVQKALNNYIATCHLSRKLGWHLAVCVLLSKIQGSAPRRRTPKQNINTQKKNVANSVA